MEKNNFFILIRSETAQTHIKFWDQIPELAGSLSKRFLHKNDLRSDLQLTLLSRGFVSTIQGYACAARN